MVSVILRVVNQLINWQKTLMYSIAMLDEQCLLCRGKCDQPTLRDSIHLCYSCRQDIEPIQPACCMCSESILTAVVPGPMLCGDCLTAPKHYDHTICIGNYDSWLRQLVLRYKRSKQLNLCITFAGCLAARLKQSTTFTSDANWLIVSVPCSIQTYRQNKYDPSQQIAQKLAKLLSLPYRNIFNRKFWFARKQQKDLTNQQRFDIPNDQYAIKPKYAKAANAVLNQRNIILVDDVITTGATINLCSSKLKQAGANKIMVLAIARSTTIQTAE